MKRLSLDAFKNFCEAGGLPGFVVDSGHRVRYQSPSLLGKIPHGAANDGRPGFLSVSGKMYAVIRHPLADAGLMAAILQPLSAQSRSSQPCPANPYPRVRRAPSVRQAIA